MNSRMNQMTTLERGSLSDLLAGATGLYHGLTLGIKPYRDHTTFFDFVIDLDSKFSSDSESIA